MLIKGEITIYLTRRWLQENLYKLYKVIIHTCVLFSQHLKFSFLFNPRN